MQCSPVQVVEVLGSGLSLCSRIPKGRKAKSSFLYLDSWHLHCFSHINNLNSYKRHQFFILQLQGILKIIIIVLYFMIFSLWVREAKLSLFLLRCRNTVKESFCFLFVCLAGIWVLCLVQTRAHCVCLWKLLSVFLERGIFWKIVILMKMVLCCLLEPPPHTQICELLGDKSLGLTYFFLQFPYWMVVVHK